MTAVIMASGAGIGLRHPHMPELASENALAPRAVPWLEIHNENFLCAGGPRLAMLDAIAARYPMSCHGVGLSLGSAEGLDDTHLARVKQLFDRVKPALISEHLAWSVTDGVYLNDLLPLPYTAQSLDVVCANVSKAQEFFGRRLLIENPSVYLRFAGTDMDEPAFLTRLVERTGCGLLLDVNNVYVSAANTGASAHTYIAALPLKAVGEIHLAGHSVQESADDRLLLDTHSTHVCDGVWKLYRFALEKTGPRPTLIEWDAEIPALPVLLGEAARAQDILDATAMRASHVT